MGIYPKTYFQQYEIKISWLPVSAFSINTAIKFNLDKMHMQIPDLGIMHLQGDRGRGLWKNREGFTGHICDRCQVFKTIAKCVNGGSKEHRQKWWVAGRVEAGRSLWAWGPLGLQSEFLNNLGYWASLCFKKTGKTYDDLSLPKRITRKKGLARWPIQCKSLLHKLEDLTLQPQHPCTKPGTGLVFTTTVLWKQM